MRSKFFSCSARSENAFDVFDRPWVGESFSVRVSSVLNCYWFLTLKAALDAELGRHMDDWVAPEANLPRDSMELGSS